MTEELKVVVSATGTAQVTRQLDHVNASTRSASLGAGKMQTAFAAAARSMISFLAPAILVNRALALFSRSLENFDFQRRAFSVLESQVRNTGMAARLTSAEMIQMASDFQKASNIGDESIVKNLTIPLTTFRNISGGMFKEVQQAALDMNTVLGDSLSGESLKGFALQLGKAFNDPMHGMARLRRSGVDFTEQQIEMAKSLQLTGDLLGAQKIVLDELKGEFGNAAAAGIKASSQLKNAWDDYLEGIGGRFFTFSNAILLTQANMLLGMADNLAKYGNKEKEVQMASFEGWAKFNTGLMLNTKALGDTMIYTFAAIFNMVTLGFHTITRAGFTFFDDMLYSIKNVSNYAVSFMEMIGMGNTDMFDDLNSAMPSKATWESLRINADKTLTDIGSNIHDLIKPWKDYEKNFSTIMWDSTKTFEKMLDLQKSISKPDAGDEDQPGADGGDSGEAYKAALAAAQNYFTQVNALNNNESQAVIDKYNAMRDEAYSYQQANLLTATQYSDAIIEIGKKESSELNAISAKRAQEEAQRMQAELDAQRQLTNDKLSAQLAYLQAVKPLTQEELDVKLEQYAIELEAYTKLGIDKAQIDAMMAAKRESLTKETNEALLAEWEKSHDLQIGLMSSATNWAANELGNMFALNVDTNNKLLASFTNMINGMIQQIAQYISQMLVAAAIKGMAFGLGNLFGSSSTVGSALIGASGPGAIKSINPNSMPIIPQTNGNDALVKAINGLQNQIAQDKKQEFNLYMDGMSLRNGINRVERNINSIGGR